jgi:hypothetical protein
MPSYRRLLGEQEKGPGLHDRGRLRVDFEIQARLKATVRRPAKIRGEKAISQSLDQWSCVLQKGQM